MTFDRIGHIARNTFREAVRDRVLYNLVFFALLLVATTPLFGKISIGLERIVLINLGLTAVTIFGMMISIFIGIGLVSKEIDKKTLYTVLSRPVRRWEFILGKYFGLGLTLLVNTFFMALGFFAALLFVAHTFTRADLQLVSALYLILLQFMIIIAITLFFSTFSSPLFSALFALALFFIGNFAGELRGLAGMLDGISRVFVLGLSYLVPNFTAMNVIAQVAHSEGVTAALLAQDTLYAILYSAIALSGATLVFENRNMK